MFWPFDVLIFDVPTPSRLFNLNHNNQAYIRDDWKLFWHIDAHKVRLKKLIMQWDTKIRLPQIFSQPLDLIYVIRHFFRYVCHTSYDLGFIIWSFNFKTSNFYNFARSQRNILPPSRARSSYSQRQAAAASSSQNSGSSSSSQQSTSSSQYSGSTSSQHSGSNSANSQPSISSSSLSNSQPSTNSKPSSLSSTSSQSSDSSSDSSSSNSQPSISRVSSSQPTKLTYSSQPSKPTKSSYSSKKEEEIPIIRNSKTVSQSDDKAYQFE